MFVNTNNKNNFADATAERRIWKLLNILNHYRVLMERNI